MKNFEIIVAATAVVAYSETGERFRIGKELREEWLKEYQPFATILKYAIVKPVVIYKDKTPITIKEIVNWFNTKEELFSFLFKEIDDLVQKHLEGQ